jgi:hypothetical protein
MNLKNIVMLFDMKHARYIKKFPLKNESQYYNFKTDYTFSFSGRKQSKNILNYFHPFFSISNELISKKIKLVTSLNSKKQVNLESLFIHKIIAKQLTNNSFDTKDIFWLPPTLSFRTVKVDLLNMTHLKIGIPFKYGGILRTLTPYELIRSLLISDVTKLLRTCPILSFCNEDYGYTIDGKPYLSAIYRTFHESLDNYRPCANEFYMNLINLSYKDENEMIYSLKTIVKNIFNDLEELIEWQLENQIGLEIHGQNLLIHKDNGFTSDARSYLYRDYGNCYAVLQREHPIKNFYKKKYGFNLDDKKIHVTHTIRRSLKFYFLGYILYNSNLLMINKYPKSKFSIYDYAYQKLIRKSKRYSFFL